MAVKTNFYLNGTKVNPPKNWQELQLELSFDKDKFAEQVSVNDWEFVLENSQTIQNWIEDGTNGGVGVFEGIPFRVEIDRSGVIETPLDGYLDLTEEATLSCNRSTVKAKERQQIDWLNDVADSFTFEYLYKATGEITSGDFVPVPYVINSVPNYLESATALLSIYVIGGELRNAIQRLKELISELSWYLTTIPAILKTVLFILYITILLISLIKLIKDMVYFLIQPVKYHMGMYAKTLLEKGAAHLGLTFKSDIFAQAPYDKLFILPDKLYNPLESTGKQILGFLNPSNSQEGFFKGTFGDFIRAMKVMFKAKVVIDGTDLILMRKDKNIGSPQFVIPPIYQPFYGLNTNEMASNYLLKFQYDLQDRNTIQEYLGTSFQVILQPKTVTNTDLVLLKHLQEIEIPFALGKIKTSLTLPEEIFKVFLDVFSVLVNGLISVVNGIISVVNIVIKAVNKIIKALAVVGIKLNVQIKPVPTLKYVDAGAIIENRIGMLKLERDSFNSAKAFLLNTGSGAKFNKLDTNNATILTARNLYNEFHYVDSFFPTTDRPNANQYLLYEFKKVPFCYDDFVKVKKNNTALRGAEEAEIMTLKWDVYNQHADIKVRINQLYTNNLIKTELEPDGR